MSGPGHSRPRGRSGSCSTRASGCVTRRHDDARREVPRSRPRCGPPGVQSTARALVLHALLGWDRHGPHPSKRDPRHRPAARLERAYVGVRDHNRHARVLETLPQRFCVPRISGEDRGYAGRGGLPVRVPRAALRPPGPASAGEGEDGDRGHRGDPPGCSDLERGDGRHARRVPANDPALEAAEPSAILRELRPCRAVASRPSRRGLSIGGPVDPDRALPGAPVARASAPRFFPNARRGRAVAFAAGERVLATPCRRGILRLICRGLGPPTDVRRRPRTPCARGRPSHSSSPPPSHPSRGGEVGPAPDPSLGLYCRREGVTFFAGGDAAEMSGTEAIKVRKEASR